MADYNADRYGKGAFQAAASPPNNDRPDFHDSPLLHSGSGSQRGQYVPTAEGEKDELQRASERMNRLPSLKVAVNPSAPPSVREMLSSAGDRFHGTLVALEHIWSQLDEWEGVQPAPANTQAFPDSPSGALGVRPPGIQEVAGTLLGLSETLHIRVIDLENRLGHLMARFGGL